MTSAAFDPLLALRTLVRHDVHFVIIGGLAGRLWGSPTVTNDLDICYDRSRDNLRALAAALNSLHATLRGAPPNLPFILGEKALRLGDSFTFDTDAGPLDCLGTPAGTKGYADLLSTAQEVELEEGVRVRFASIDDLIRMKSTAGRPKDRIEVEVLAAVREELRNRS